MSKIAAVTGAASGIGHAACRRLLQAGWTVFGPDNARGRLDAVAEADLPRIRIASGPSSAT